MTQSLIPAWSALLALAISIFLIVRKFPPVYALMFGAFAGAIVAAGDITYVVGEMSAGAKDITPAILRVLAAGVLAGTLVGTGSAEKIARSITYVFGEKKAVYAIIFASFVLTLSGVFIDVAVLTVAPIAMAVAGKSGASRIAILIALIGGGKSGNAISPNPNTISAAANFNAPLSEVMFVNIGAAVVGIIATVAVVWFISRRKNSESRVESNLNSDTENLPSIWAALSGPVVAIGLLVQRPVFDINIDPIIALPAGSLVCSVVSGKIKSFFADSTSGLAKMTPVAVLLLGTGCLGGIIKASTLKDAILSFIELAGVSDIFIAPVSGALMSAATASTTAGAAIASATFSEAVLATGISAVWGAAMTNAGAIVFDQMPHGSFFHVSAGSVNMTFADRLKLVPYESVIGFAIATASMLSCVIFR